MDLIDRQAAIDAVRSYYDECDEREESIEERIEQLPSAERHGKWLHKNSTFKNRWLCSECGYTWYFDTKEASYCPHCGARMRGE